jgi:hypothetical protein
MTVRPPKLLDIGNEPPYFAFRPTYVSGLAAAHAVLRSKLSEIASANQAPDRNHIVRSSVDDHHNHVDRRNDSLAPAQRHGFRW